MKRMMALILAAAMALCAGCGAQNQPEQPAQAEEAAESTPEPLAQVAIDTNPVSIFYSNYRSATEAMEALFRSRLEQDDSTEAADTLLQLASHDLAVSEGNATFSWLLSSDGDNTFASSVTGAAEGQGAIVPHGQTIYLEGDEEQAEEAAAQEPESTPNEQPEPGLADPALASGGEADNGDQGYDLLFEYSDGSTLSGTLTSSTLSFCQNGDEEHGVTVEFEDNVWVSTVVHADGIVTTVRCDGDGFHFTVAKYAGGEEPDETVYDWLSDGNGAKLISSAEGE